MSTIAKSITPKLLELYTPLYGVCLAGAQIIFPKCGRGLASRSVQWERDAWQTLFSLGAQVQTVGL